MQFKYKENFSKIHRLVRGRLYFVAIFCARPASFLSFSANCEGCLASRFFFRLRLFRLAAFFRIYFFVCRFSPSRFIFRDRPCSQAIFKRVRSFLRATSQGPRLALTKDNFRKTGPSFLRRVMYYSSILRILVLC